MLKGEKKTQQFQSGQCVCVYACRREKDSKVKIFNQGKWEDMKTRKLEITPGTCSTRAAGVRMP